MKQSVIFLLVLLLLNYKSVTAQDFLWTQVFAAQLSGDVYGTELGTDDAGNLYLCGNFYGTVDFDPGPGVFTLSSGDYYISKLTPNGDFIWAKQLSDGPGNINIYDMVTDGSGNSYITGFFEGTVDFDPNAGVQNLSSPNSSNVFILKLDSSGTFSWVKQIGAPIFDESGWRVAVDGSGNVYLAGKFEQTVDFDPGIGLYNLTSNGDDDIFVLKLDASGDFAWAYSEGGTDNDIPHSIALDNSGNIYVASELGTTATNIMKLDNGGSHSWTKTISSPEYYNSLTVDNSTGILLTARFTGMRDFDPGPGVQNLTSAGSTDIFLLKLDFSGNFIWVKQIGGTGYDGVSSVQLNSTGDIFMYGQFRSTCDFDPGPQQANLTAITDGNSNNNDIFILKLSASGDFVWVRQIGNKQAEIDGEFLLDDQDNILLSGAFLDTVDFNPGSGVYELSTGTTGYGAFVLKLASTTGIPITAAGNTIAIYPNPSSGSFTVAAPASISKVIVTDVLGRLVYSAAPHSTQAVIELKAAPGMHYVTVSTESGSTTQKIVVE